jgi:LysR family transcriptional regulator, hypochlorite-specific transcription factor HypT
MRTIGACHSWPMFREMASSGNLTPLQNHVLWIARGDKLDGSAKAMKIDILHDFLSIATTQSLTQSAEERSTTQSNLSKRVRQLEIWLGRDLIDRRSRPLSLTKAGCDFIPIARGMLAELDAFRGAQAPWSVAEGAASIAMPHSATLSIYPAFKQKLLKQLPNARFAARLANHDGVAAMIARSECDLALATLHPKVPQSEEFTVFRSVAIATERLVVVSPPNTRKETVLPLHVSHRLTYIGQIWQKCRIPVATSKEVEHGMAADIRVYCLSGEGRGVLPETLVEAEIESGRLELTATSEDLSYSVSLYCAPKASLQAKKIWKTAYEIYSRK